MGPQNALAQALKAQLEAEALIKKGRPGEALAQLRDADREGIFTGVAVSLVLRNYYVDIPFSADLYSAAAQADGWQAKAVAVAVSRSGGWSDAQAATADGICFDAASQTIGAARGLGMAQRRLRQPVSGYADLGPAAQPPGLFLAGPHPALDFGFLAPVRPRGPARWQGGRGRY
ncbi:hypothetical protein JIX56_05105 [Streptomyces sp. CA-210063]|uniref:hypothetical protein n=1 Tax=Streptomyces sp. CA-210063 TaxID=2801029 RepID=UPI00214CAB6B|nr:hypothetical protein [Streptomyces sp. CA-210063]UUU29322.1 hypothetical protein JIX56_05105 [Streptomyces sp. CA-210063]